jgi:hypothetical protein
MAEQDVEQIHHGAAVLDIGEDIGALIIYTGKHLRGQEIEVSRKEEKTRRIHTAVLERRVNGRSIFAALFLSLTAGEYIIWTNNPTVPSTITIAGGQVAEIDWRGSITPASLIGTPHHHEPGGVHTTSLPAVPLDQLPPRYRSGKAVSTAPMGSAPLRYTADGQVAWDQMWTTFCDLALAGGPRHRATILEPGTLSEIQADPDSYERVVDEIARGLRLVTGLSTVRSKVPGWVGLCCTDEEMARWLLQAIQVENVSVQQQETTVFLPAGPAFQLDKEIKNVVTVVAKTHHYWMEHRLAQEDEAISKTA